MCPPPIRPPLDPPSHAPPPPRGLLPTDSWGGSWRPEPRGRPPPPGARPQRTEEKGTTCMLEKPNLNPVDAFAALLAKILGAETPPQKGCRKGVPAHKGCAKRVQKGGSSAERGAHKGRTKGAKTVQKGC